MCSNDFCDTTQAGVGFCRHDPEPSSTVCRASAGACDVAEHCTGTSLDCPADAFQPSTFECRASAGDCDVAEHCTGTSADCPADAFQPSTFECRASAGDCDVAENCTGTSATCPTDAFKANTVECRASAGDCDVAENCTGTSATCPADAFKPSTFECRASAGVCDVAENCTGTSATCPADAFKANTVECRPSAGFCDVAENCTGSSADCPADAFKPSSQVCRASAGICDVAENCTGTSAACPADALRPSTFECRPGDGVCDPAENCTGTSVTCPPDVVFDPTLVSCENQQVLVCRTAGFWATHAGTEKKGSVNITAKVIDAANGVLNDHIGELLICGEHLVNTAVNDAASAVEALCVSVQGNQRLQLARQLTAAALNCIVSGGAGDCSTVPAYASIFGTCDAACAANTPTSVFGACIDALDCLNSGGDVLATGFCQTGHCSDNDAPCNDSDRTQCASPSTATCVPLVGTCHDEPLCPVGLHDLCFNETGPAGSSNACNDAIKTACTVVGTGELKCTTDSRP